MKVQKLNPISNREIEVLQHLSLGMTTQEIAQSLFLSKHTIITHRRNLLLKMDAPNVACLVRRGFEFGYLQLAVSN